MYKTFFKEYNKTLKKMNRSLISSFKDIDRDGVSNLRDCSPFDKRRQHIKPSKSMEKEIGKLPLFFTASEAVPGKGRYYPYSAKRMSKDAYKAKRRFLSTARKRPEIIGEIQRLKPKAVVVTTHGIEKHGYGTAHSVYEPSETGGRHTMVIRASSRQGQRYGLEDIHETAGTVMHEGEHLRQFKEVERRPSMDEVYFKGRYSQQPGEKLAEKAAEKAVSKHLKVTYGAKKHFWERFGEMTEDEE